MTDNNGNSKLTARILKNFRGEQRRLVRDLLKVQEGTAIRVIYSYPYHNLETQTVTGTVINRFEKSRNSKRKLPYMIEIERDPLTLFRISYDRILYYWELDS